MKTKDLFAFSIRVLAFLITYYFMIDYLFICNVKTSTGAITTIIGIAIISILYYPLRGKYLHYCDKCHHKSGFKS